ncbi:beta strand repeat-containing protein [Pedobacter steynii]|nr:Ig-like domain-containing protein [Pedobacter steynii]
MRYLKTIILLWVSILACLTANAQSANSHTASAGGGTGALPGGSTVDFTVGEAIISTIGTNPIFTQGLHQTLLFLGVTNVSSTNTVTLYKEGGVINVTITFDQPVFVTGNPELALNSGGKAIYASGSGTNTLNFTYTVAAGETSADLDYTAINSLTLAGGSTIQNAMGANAALTLPAPGAAGSLGANKDFVIDTTAPNAPSTPVMATASDSGVSNSDNITNVTIPVFTGTAEAGSTVTLYDTDGTTVLGTGVATGGNWSITATTMTEGAHTLTAKATDAAGNEGLASAGLVVTIDATAPTLAITSDVPQLKAGETATITFTFSEDPGTTFAWDGTTGDVVVTGGTLGAISGSGLTRTATFTPTPASSGTASITVAAATYTDAAGNDGGAGITPALIFDTVIPNAPSAPVLATASDSGISNSDNITNVTIPVFTGTAEAGSTVTLYDTDGTTVLGTGVATGGNWSITSSVLAPGVHTVTAKATDAVGNESPASAGLAVTIDTTAPTLAITSDVPQLKAGETATITFTFSEDPGTTFAWDGTTGDVVVSGGTLGAISGSGLTRTATFTPTPASSGTVSITVAAATYTDVAGNDGGAGSTPALTFDTSVPNAPSAPVLATASDSGVSNSDNITNVTIPVFTGTAEPGSTVTLYDTDGTTVLGTGIATGGNWSITSSVLTPGVHAVTAKATDAVGNESPASAGLVVTIDTTAPTLAITSDVPQLKAGETATITFTFSEDPGTTFAWDGTIGDIVITGGTLGAISGSGLTRTSTFTPTPASSGTVSITVAAATYTDVAGNDGGAGTTPALTFDTAIPNAPSTPVLATASDSGISNSDNITNVTTPVFTGTAEPGSTVTLYVTDGTVAGTSVIGTGIATAGNWSITSSTLIPGARTIIAKATDAIGNISPASSGLIVTIDTTAPTLAITSDVPQLKSGETANITFTFSEDPGTTFAWDGTTGDVVVSGGTLGAVSGSGLIRTATFTPTPASTGTASITVAAATYTDVAGNDGGAGSTPALTFDTSVPNAPSAPVLATASDSGISNSDNITNVTTPVFTGTAEPGSTVTLYDTDGTTVIGTGIATGGNWSITASTLTPGTHTITAKATDAVGNESPASAGLAVTIDTTAPTLAITSDVPQLKSGETANITFTFSEDPGTTFAWDGTTGDVVVTGGTLGAISGSGLTRTATFTPTPASSGTVSITVAAATYTDAAGNDGGAGTTPALTFDTQSPNAPSAPVLAAASDSGISNSDNITNVTTPVFTGTAEPGSTVTLYDTDGTTVIGTGIAIGGNWSITASTLTPGTHTITAKATDAVGNESPASAGLAVTIDTTAPTLAITSDVPQLKSGETANITFTFSEDPGTTFAWDGTTGDVVVSGGTLGAISGSGLTRTATFTPTPASSGTVSITVAAATYTDAAGNDGGAGTTPALTFDTQSPNAPSAPVLAAASDSGISNSDNITNVTTPVFTGTAEPGSTVTLYDTDGTTVIGTGIATGGNWSITASTLTPGTHTITAKATDAVGNESPASAGLAVTIDTTAPTLAITSDVPQLKSGETANITFTFSEDPGTTFAWDGTTGDVVVTGGTLGAISGSGLTRTATFTPTPASSGTVSITVAAATYTDAAGNDGGAGTTPALTFDTQSPNAPSAPVLAAASDSGISNSDNITNVTTPVFTGTAEPGSTVTLYDTDGTTVIGTGVAAGGNWSITASTLTPGTHTITAKATDAVGNESPASAGLAVTIDTTAPTLAITSDVPQLKSGETANITFTSVKIREQLLPGTELPVMSW